MRVTTPPTAASHTQEGRQDVSGKRCTLLTHVFTLRLTTFIQNCNSKLTSPGYRYCSKECDQEASVCDDLDGLSLGGEQGYAACLSGMY